MELPVQILQRGSNLFYELWSKAYRLYYWLSLSGIHFLGHDKTRQHYMNNTTSAALYPPLLYFLNVPKHKVQTVKIKKT